VSHVDYPVFVVGDISLHEIKADPFDGSGSVDLSLGEYLLGIGVVVGGIYRQPVGAGSAASHLHGICKNQRSYCQKHGKKQKKYTFFQVDSPDKMVECKSLLRREG
jgi:hypothetical protein